MPTDDLFRLDEWRNLPRAQTPHWPDPVLLGRVTAFLSAMEPVVQAAEVDRLNEQLERVCRGDGFIVQGGDCAETFADNTLEHVTGTAGALRDMAATIGAGFGGRILTIGRIAGQYAKPRSADVDKHGLPSWRGDMVNLPDDTLAARTPNPLRIVLAYVNAVETVNRISEYGIFYSHEALVLEYERALTRIHGGRPYSLSGHLLWIGERTRQATGAHVGLLSRLANPVAVKLGPAATADEAIRLCEVLNPGNRPGRLILTTRLGAQSVRSVLPPIVEKVTAAGHSVIWQCDPMHGNTITLGNGYRTRPFDRIADEIDAFFDIHRRLGTHPGGLHIELAAEDITECSGGSGGISEDEVPLRFDTAMDPRLNGEQAKELANYVSDKCANHARR